MEQPLKIAIYSGNIPSSTFIENLIKGISIKHEILLFGKLKSKPLYSSKSIQYFPTFSNQLRNLLYTKWRTFLLIVKYPKRFQILWKQVKTYPGLYEKYNWWSRYAPVLLHLPDIFHIQWAKDIEHWYFLKEALGCKIVLSLRGAHINYSPIANKELAATYSNYFPRIDAFHAVSDAIDLEAQKYGADATKITTIHSMIPQRVFDLYTQLEERKNKKSQIISVGRHHWIKGYNLALDACRELKQQQIPFEYTIIADGKIQEELIFQRHELGLTEEVNFQGVMLQKEVFKKMQESDVLLLPSMKEGMPNVVLEAMAIGVPVISTNCGGMSEVVIPDKTGWLVASLNGEAIAEELMDFYNTPIKKRQQIASNAHNFVKMNFSADNGIEQFNKLYKEVMRS